MKNITAALEYHDRTKHRPHRYAASLGYMDWATQPYPFRRYENTRLVSLTHTEITPPYHLLFTSDPLPEAPLCLEALSQLLRYSLGLAAWKSYGGSTWALRCNASSGNLHPSECYLILPPIAGISTHTTLAHYAPKEHALEILSEYDSPEGNPEGEIIVLLSSVLWREAWKYGERSWRYCQLDAGHASNALHIGASMLGWKCEKIPLDTADASEALGFNDTARFAPLESESVDLALRIALSPSRNDRLNFPLPAKTPEAKANVLSPSHHEWQVIYEIDKASAGIYPLPSLLQRVRKTPSPSKSSGEIILKRRSAQMMDGSRISESAFRQIMDATFFERDSGDVNFILFVHRVEGLESGLYAYIRDPKEYEALRNAMDENFEWTDCADGLYLLGRGDYRGVAQSISCNQEIAKECAFSFGMLSSFGRTLETYGAAGYKNLFHQCGAIGQMLYLEATSLGLSATGIGCFLDDEFHALLGLRDTRYQSLYHFTIGRAIVDTRITTLPPYGSSVFSVAERQA